MADVDALVESRKALLAQIEADIAEARLEEAVLIADIEQYREESAAELRAAKREAAAILADAKAKAEMLISEAEAAAKLIQSAE